MHIKTGGQIKVELKDIILASLASQQSHLAE